MHRRRFLKLGAGLAAGYFAGARAVLGAEQRIAVIGAGIVGASIAWNLARRGARVVLLDREGPAAGATSRSFAWLNAHYSKQPFHYHLLNRLGVEMHRVLATEFGSEYPAEWGGTIEWNSDAARAEELRRMTRQLVRWGYPVRLVEPQEMARLAPAVRPGAAAAASFAELEGATDAAATTRLFVRRAQQAGAETLFPCQATGIAGAGRGAREILTARGEIAADVVVIAGGVETPRMAGWFGAEVPLKRSAGIVLRSAPVPRLVRRVMVGEAAHFWQARDGSMLIGDDFGPPVSPAHKALESRPRDFPDAATAGLHAARIRGQAAKYLPQLEKAKIKDVMLCWRPLPKDDLPVIGFSPAAPHVYLAVTHSGVTLGPLIGRLAATEILDGAEVELLQHYRPARFSSRAA
jgi:glycine/D-amino acid oxidase-like deaminating enzyme